MPTFSERLRQLRTKRGWSQQVLANQLNISKSSINMYERGEREPGIELLETVADLFNVDMDYLIGRSDIPNKHPIFENTLSTNTTNKSDYSHIHNVIPLPISQKQVPLYDGIACGEPKFADSRMADMINLPEGVSADFAIVCHGDSMINLRIKDGDIVFIRDQQDVDDGEVAAVLIEDDATLKKVYHKPNGLLLMPANENYEPQIYTPDQLLNIRIMGKAVAFLSPVE